MKFRQHQELRRRSVLSSFDQTIHDAKLGDDRAISILYLDYVAMVYGYLRALGLAEAEDATSEVFVGMLRGLGSFNGDEPDFRRWLMTIAHRRMIDQRRRQGRNRTDLSQSSSLEVLKDRCSVGDPQALEMDADLVEAFGGLTEAQREVLALRFVADVSIQGVAAITGRPTTAVKSLQNRGLESLRRRLSAPKERMEA